jgi:hypothetical protein
MPAQSKAQQRFMGMVHAADKGETPASPEVAKVSKYMDDTDAKDFASTKHKGLPDKIKEVIIKELRSVRAIQTDYSKVLNAMETHLDLYKKSKGTSEEKTHLEHLKKLTALKKKYTQELEDRVKGIYQDADLQIDEMGSGDIHFKKVMEYYHNGTPSVRKQVAIVVCGDKNASRLDIVRELHSMGYDEIQEVEKDLGISIKEMTTSDAAGAYSTPYAFGKPENEKSKGKRQANLTGYSVVQENRWVDLKKEDSTPITKVNRGISNVNKQLAEIEKFLGWYGRLKNENGVTNEHFWKRTNSNIYKIKERLIKLEQQIRKISQ